MKNLVVVVLSALITAVGVLYWLHDGDLEDAVEPVIQQWTAPASSPDDVENITPKL